MGWPGDKKKAGTMEINSKGKGSQVEVEKGIAWLQEGR